MQEETFKMIVNLKLYKELGVILVDKNMSVSGEFDILRLRHWKHQIQSYLNDIEPNIPDAPDYAIWAFYLDEDYNHKTIDSAVKHDTNSIKEIVEGYYKKNVCPNLDISNNYYQNEDLVEMRSTTMFIVKRLTKLSHASIRGIYEKSHSTTSYCITKYIPNRYETSPLYRERFNDIKILLNEPNLTV